MAKRIFLEAQPLRDLRYLANEICPLLREPADKEQRHLNLQQVIELAETAWRKLRDGGPVHDGLNAYFRALPERHVECLVYDPKEGALPRRVVYALDIEQWPLWMCLQTAEYCGEVTYAFVKDKALEATLPGLQEAKQRWAEAEEALRVEGLLPVRVLAPPSAAGGARYVCEHLVSNDLLPGLRETLADWGGYILSHRKAWPGSSYYTLSLERVDDQWRIASMMVFQLYADRADREGEEVPRG